MDNKEFIKNNNYEFSIGMKPSPDILLDVSNQILNIEKLFEKKQHVLINGIEESGKSVITTEFTKSKNCFSVYFSKYNKSDFSLNYVLENLIPQISNQLNFNVEDSEINVDFFRRLQNKLRQKKSELFYFVLDGLEHANQPFIEEILDLINLDVYNFRFLFTDNNRLNKDEILRKIEFETNSVIGFGKNEIKNYFKEFDLRDDNINEIHYTSNGIPSRLKIIKERLIETKDYNLLEIKDKFESWLEYDIEKDLKKITSEELVDYNLYIALISLSDALFTLNDISVGFGEDVSKIETLFKSLDRFFEINNSVINFTSNIYKDIFKKKYSLLNDKIKNIEIKINFEQPELKYKIRLIELLFDEDNYTKILSDIENNFIANAFNHVQNITLINQIIDKITKSSYHLNKYDHLFNYSIQGSIINDIENDIENENAILSLISLGEYEKAIITADSLTSKKNKLLYYSKIARNQKEKNGRIDDVLLDKINNIFDILDLLDYGKDLDEIVSDLIFISSKYALSILNREDNNGNSNINELLLTNISLAALNQSDNNSDPKFTEILSKIESDNAKSLNTALKLYIGNYSFEKLNEEILNYKDSKERIRLYRFWLENTDDKKNIDTIITDVVNEIVKDGNNDIFNLEVLSDISKHIFKIEEHESRIRIAERFKVLLTEVEDNGLFINKSIFKLNLFNCYYNNEKDSTEAQKILDELLIEINSYPDLLIKCEALMLVVEYVFDKVNYLGQIKTKVISLFFDNFKELLLETSDQYTPIKRILKSVSKTNFDLSNRLIKDLNTSFNRDKARVYIINEYLNQKHLNINIDSINLFKNDFHEEYYGNVVDRMILKRFSDVKELNALHVTKLKQICYSNDDNLSSFNKIYKRVLLLKILKNSNQSLKIIEDLENKIEDGLKNIQDSYKKNNFCQFIISKISSFDKKFAKEIYLKYTSEDLEINSKLRYKLVVLLINNFEAIVKLNSKDSKSSERQFLINDYFNKILYKIDEIDEIEDNLDLYTRLGFVCYLNNLDKEAREIYKKVFDNYSKIIKTEPVYEYINSLTYIYLFNQSYIINNNSSLPDMVREELYNDLCNFYLFKQNPYDVYDSKNSSFKCDFSDIVNCLGLLENMNFDINIYNIIEKISKLIDCKTISLERIQLNDIKNKIDHVIKSSFPDPNNIKHDGYKIISKIKFQKLYKNYKLIDLKNEIDKIPNLSDKIFVKVSLIEEYSNFKNPEIQKEIICNEVISDFGALRNNYEFINRVNDLSDIMFKLPNNKKWKELVSSAYDISMKLENKVNSVKYQNKIIDTIYKLDENLAKQFVNKGIEESKKSISKYIKKHYENLKDMNILSEKVDINNDKIKIDNYVRSLVNNIKDVNSNLVKSKKISELKSSLVIASKEPFDNSNIIYNHYFKNLSTANYSKPEFEKTFNILIDNLDSLLNSYLVIEIVSKVKNSKSYNLEENQISENHTLENHNVIIKGTERNKALEIFKKWIIEESDEFLYIIDPYFNSKDAEFLYNIYLCDKILDIKILACNHFEKQDLIINWEKITKDEIKDCEIIFTYFKNNNGKFPLHDRYLISKSSGLRLGTSINSIGSSLKFSEISRMNIGEVNTLLNEELLGFITGKRKEVYGERLERMTYSI